MTLSEPIAIAGIGCRFPGGANDPTSFWKLMMDGVDAIREVPTDRWSTEKYYDPRPGRPGRSISRWGGFVEDPSAFDHEFFGISPREAASFDPQHKLLLLTAAEALNDACQTPAPTAAPRDIGVFVGISTHEFSQLQSAPQELGHLDAWSLNSIAATLAANRISFAFNLSGPSMAVDTACSSSLVALHLACEAIRRGECSAALAGGANVLYHAAGFVSFSSAGMLSPQGRCRAFDKSADGFVRAEGAGLIFLLPAAEARRQGLQIYAEVLATAVNQDARKPSLTAPSPIAQADLIRTACRRAGVAPSSLRYIEAHGTGTPVGDPVEAGAIGEVVGIGRREPCLLGSVKTNIGHLEAAAGIAGAIKASLCLHHGVLPRNLHFTEGNPAIDFDRLRLRVVNETTPLEGDTACLVGVNSFGFGGANAHAVLRGAAKKEERARRPADRSRSVLLAVSAKSAESLSAFAARYRDFLAEENAPQLEDVCFSAGERHSSQPHRVSIVANGIADMRTKLGAVADGTCPAGASRGRALEKNSTGPVFVFCGQGSQWWQMGCELMQDEPVFRAKLEEIHFLIKRNVGWSLIDELARDEARSKLDDTAIAQPSIFAIQVALTALWAEWGITPSAVIGHSVGEAAAAHVSGALDLEEATRVICQRAKAMSVCRGTGAMLSVALPVAEVQAIVASRGGRVAVGAINSPRSAVISGQAGDITELGRELTERGIPLRRVRVDYAFHSALMDPARASLEKSLAKIHTRAPSIPLFSTVTASRCEDGEWDAAYWWRNIRQPVLFADTLAAMFADGHRDFLEVGPHPVLGGSMLECLRNADGDARVFSSLRRHQAERETLLVSLGAMVTAGYSANWAKIYPDSRSVRLPAYPWKLESTWTELPACQAARFGPSEHPLLGRKSLDAPNVWTGRVGTTQQDYFAGHRVNGQPVFPAAAYVEMALAAARERKPTLPLAVDELQFLRAMPLPVQEGTIQTRLRLGLEGSFLQIESRASYGQDWILHARGRVAGAEGLQTPPNVNLSDLEEALPNTTTGEELRANLHRRGLELDGAFSGLQSVRWSEGEALARVSRPEKSSDDPDFYSFHPAFFDACFGALACTVPGWNDTGSNKLFLPIAFDRVRLYAEPPSNVYAHAKLTRADSFIVSGDLRVFDDQGHCVAEILGFHARAVPMGQTAALSERGLYNEEWLATEHKQETRIASDMRILLVASCQQASDRHAKDWQQQRNCARQMVVSSEGTEAAAREVIEILRHDPSINVVFCASELQQEGPFPSPDQVGLLAILRALASWRDLAVRFFLLTKGARAVSPGENTDPFQASLWGLLRTAQAELPHASFRAVDTDGQFQLWTELADMSLETEVAWRSGKRFAARLRHARLPELHGVSARAESCMQVRLREPGPGVELRRAARASEMPSGKVRIRVDAAGVNFRDTMKSLGIYPTSSHLDLLLGDECAGVITEVGSGVQDFRPGDRVFAVTPGCFAGETAADAWRVAKRPAGLAPEAAATMPVAFLTALYSLREVGRLRKGEKVLIHSAAGGVGSAAVQLAKMFGAEIFATAGSEEKRELVARMGAKHVFDSRTLEFRDKIMEATDGRGVDVVLNSLSGEFLVQSLACLAPGGRFLEIGKRDLYENSKIGLGCFRSNQSFTAIDMAQILFASPEQTRALLREITALAEADKIQPLPCKAYPLSNANDALHDMAQGKHSGKLVLTVSRAADEKSPGFSAPPFASNATYLVTGGTRGFGFATAEWMAANGARSLALVGSGGTLDPAAQRQVEKLRSQGVDARVFAVDVADRQRAEQLIAKIREEMPQLRGVIHAATRYASATLARADEENLAVSLAAKAKGALNLHKATARDNLDFFVLYSSVAGILGNAGQASYAAANAFLEALAQSRRAHGLPALAVSWGVIGDTGHVSENASLAEMLGARGLQPVPASEALSVLGELMSAGAAHAVVADVDWSRAAQGLGSEAVAPRLRTLAGENSSATHGNRPFREFLAKLPPSQRPEAMCKEMISIMADVLRVPAESIHPSTELQDLGLDSLISIEAAIRLERRLGMAIPPGSLAAGKTIGMLSEQLLALASSAAPADLVSPTATCAEERNPPPSAETNALGRADTFLRPIDPTATGTGIGFQIEWLALRMVATLFATGNLSEARRRLRVLMPFFRLALRQDYAWALKNLRLVFGDGLDERAREKLARVAMENHLASYIESGFSHQMEFEFDRYAQLLQMAGDHGVILCGVHLGSWEPFLRWAPDLGLKLAAIYRPTRNPLSERFFQKRRASYGVEWIPSSDVRAMAQAVDDRKIVAFMTDLNVYESKVFADFLGVPASCGTGPAALAALKGVPMIPAVGIRESERKVVATFGDAVSASGRHEAATEIANLTTRIVRFFEPWILEYPEQYNWLHPRWRARPDGTTWSLATPDLQMAMARISPHAELPKRLCSQFSS